MSHIFVSYVREDWNIVDGLVHDLSNYVDVWIDRNEVAGGDHQEETRKAIKEAKAFVVCFSKRYAERDLTHLNRELRIAIGQLELRGPHSKWLLPVLLDSEAKIPAFPIEGSGTLDKLDYVDLDAGWESGIRKLLNAFGPIKKPRAAKARRPSLPKSQLELLAFDVGGTFTRVAHVTPGRPVRPHKQVTKGAGSPKALMDELVRLVNSQGPAKLPIGIASSGIVAAGTVTSNNLRLKRYPLEANLAQRLGRPVTVLNDAHAAAWGEHCAGAGRGINNFMFVTISTGIGAALVLDGELLMASDGLTGELGQMQTEVGLTLEEVASGSGVARRAFDAGFSSVRAVFKRAEAGDPKARSLISPGLELLARSFANARVLLGIERIVLGGSIGLRPGVLAELRRYIDRQLPMYKVAIEPASLGDSAGVYGVAYWLSQFAPASISTITRRRNVGNARKTPQTSRSHSG